MDPDTRKAKTIETFNAVSSRYDNPALRFFSESAAKLKPGGRIVISCLYEDSFQPLVEILSKRLERRWIPAEHTAGMTDFFTCQGFVMIILRLFINPGGIHGRV
jgi:hypothetical protein